MWYVKNVQKAASKAYNSANQNIKKIASNIKIPKVDVSNLHVPKISILSNGKNQSENQVEKAIKSISKNKKEIMPTTKLSKLAQMSYQIQKFQQILKVINKRLEDWKYSSKKAKQTLNMLVLVCYLIKHGASGFIDQFRDSLSTFQSYKEVRIQNSFLQDQQQKAKLNTLITQIKERAKYIVFLLTDKKKLLKEKELAMMIKQKIITGEKEKYTNQNRDSNIGNQKYNLQREDNDKKMSQKVDSFLQHYVWKYWNKFDEKMQILADKIIQKIDEYIDIEQPQAFQIDQLQQQEKRPQKSQIKSSVLLQQQNKFHKVKNTQKPTKVQQLIDLDTDIQSKQQKPVLNVELV